MKNKEKYKEFIKILTLAGKSEFEIALAVEERNDLEGTIPITVGELKSMNSNDLKSLTSYCWKNDRPRCICKGISDLSINENNGSFEINFSDENGDPYLYFNGDDSTVIYKLGDGIWKYGLFKSI